MSICITATGLYTPPYSISNEELVATFNQYVDNYNAKNADAIARGEKTALVHSTAEFIEKASGIKSRYVMEKDGILNPDIMAPVIPYRKLGEEMSIMAEMGLDALKQALDNAGLQGKDLDGIIVACSNFQRVYPAIAIEIQQYIGMQGGVYNPVAVIQILILGFLF
jgi:beta-ketodecanoyl-[acyl-carrier-protein] synthase